MGVVGVSHNKEMSCVKQRIKIGRENARCDMQTHEYAEVGLFEHKRVDGKIVWAHALAPRVQARVTCRRLRLDEDQLRDGPRRAIVFLKPLESKSQEPSPPNQEHPQGTNPTIYGEAE